MKTTDLLVDKSLVASKGEARKLLANGGVRINGVMLFDDHDIDEKIVHAIQIGRNVKWVKE